MRDSKKGAKCQVCAPSVMEIMSSNTAPECLLQSHYCVREYKQESMVDWSLWNLALDQSLSTMKLFRLQTKDHWRSFCDQVHFL